MNGTYEKKLSDIICIKNTFIKLPTHDHYNLTRTNGTGSQMNAMIERKR